MIEQHPITPPPELRRLWAMQAQRMDPHDPVAWMKHVSTQAARWGADVELEACCDLALTDPCCGTKFQRSNLVKNIRNRRRPKLLSLKEQAIVVLDDLQSIDATHYNILRNALEQLND